MTFSWLQDRIFKRLFANASWLMGGNIGAAVIGLANMALTTRILGLQEFGIYALITTYVAIFDRLLNFQSWQALIKYGAEANATGDSRRFAQLMQLGTWLDGGSAFAGMLIGMAVAPVAAHFLEFTPEQTVYLVLFNVVIASHLAGVPTAILRLYDRYYAMAFQKVAAACLTLIGLLIAWYHGGGLADVLIVVGLTQIIGNLFLLGYGWYALGREGHRHVWSIPLKGVLRENEGILKFVFYTNIESSVKIFRQLDLFVIKILISAEAVAIYRIARRLTDTLNMAVDPFFYAIYPELSKFFAQKDYKSFDKLIVQSSVMVGCFTSLVFIGFVILGPYFIDLVFGDKFSGVYPLAVICIMCLVVWSFAFPLSPALYSMGFMRRIFYTHLVTALAYLALVYIMVSHWGTMGGAWALFIFYSVWAATMALMYSLKRRDISKL